MARSKIRKDSHGLFVRANGYVVRPDYAAGYKHLEAEKGDFKEGETVNVSHIGGSPLSRLKRVGGKATAIWYSHGPATYWDESAGKAKQFDSEIVYRPDYEYWG